MEKEIKSCMGVLLRADLTKAMKSRVNQQIPAKKDGMAVPVRTVLKRTPVQDFNSFFIMFYYIIRFITTIYQKNGDLFCSFVFLDFRKVC